MLDWYHWAVADGADSEAYLPAAMRRFPQWASDLFEHAVITRALENPPAGPDLDAEEEARLMERKLEGMRSAAAQVLLQLEETGE